ncbi:CaiB/BaiF CoA transferase family protein [Halalkalicoccus ordinarius]|uniref:CaiB/BaiF CoA transferase family protein n=1 Tax=Halalkalicoccus ordinarius TaxID=3116651 RepID=UPI00300F6DCD
MQSAHQPLEGLRVIDFSGMIAGGFATMQLADFGADVVTIEHPKYPDPLRSWPPFDEEESLWWKSIGRNKRCITLDLSTEDGKKIALKLVEDADLVFENFRPGTMERWGLGPEQLQEVNASVILVRVSGFGQTGPLSDHPGFGTIAEGFSGWAHVNGFPDREPLLPPISLADLTAGLFAVHGAMFALYEQHLRPDHTDGDGQVVDISLYEPLFRLFAADVETYDRLERVPERTGNHHPSAAPRGIYETTDGWITLSASSQAIYENVVQAIDRTDLIEDERFRTNDRRVENADLLDEIIEAWTRERSTDEVLETMRAHDAIVGPVYDIADIYEDEQFNERDNIVEMDDETFGTLQTPSPVPKLSKTPGEAVHAGMPQGHHNKDVFLNELNLSTEEYDRLRDEGVI